MISLIYLLFNGYPSDTIVIPIVVLGTVRVLVNAVKQVREEL